MNNLVLQRVAATLDASIRGALVRGLTEEGPWRVRLDLRTGEGRDVCLTYCIRPESPWMARPSPRPALRPRPGGFVARYGNDLRGAFVGGVDKPSADRTVTVRLRGGPSLVAELAPGSPNLVLVGGDGIVVGAARRPRAAGDRVAPGKPYRVRDFPDSMLDPFRASRDDLHRAIERAAAEAGDSDPARTIARGLAGLGPTDIALVLAEAASAGRRAADVLTERLAAMIDGRLEPVVESRATDPADVSGWRLLPWEPAGPPPGDATRWALGDASLTAGRFHDAVDRLREAGDRGRALVVILDREIARLRRTEARVEADRAGFGDADRYRAWGEALLAGVGRARRAGDHVVVPDPWDETRTISIPVKPPTSPPKAAEQYFVRHRRAVRGLAEAERRRDRVRSRRTRLDQVRDAHGDPANPEDVDALERAMQQAGVPVAVRAGSRAAEQAARAMPPRLEGVRVFRARDGGSILAGKTGRDNQRLTFQLAGPEDFWLHALGVPGAHVVLRNDGRSARPPERALEEAAAVAAHFSDARTQSAVDVQWTRRKYVRKAKGAPPGTVLLKKFETVRVKPALPDDFY